MIGRAPITTGSIALVMSLALPPSVAMADCEAWKLLHNFNAVQDNGFNVVFEVDVSNGKVSGSAHYFTGDDFHRVDGNVLGDFDGLNFDVDVAWPDHVIGNYRGGINEGVLKGTTQQLHGPEAQRSKVYWRSKQRFQCAQAEPPPPPPPAATPEEKAGIFENQQKGIGAILKETKP